MFIYHKTLGGQSKGVWFYFRFWNHTFYIGDAPDYPDGKYRLEILGKSWRRAIRITRNKYIPIICPVFKFSKYKKKAAA